MQEFITTHVLTKFFTENININMGMAIIFCLLLVLGTRAVRAFLRMADIAMIPVRETFKHINKWTGGFLGEFFWVGNCGLWLCSGAFTAAFGFSEQKLQNISYLPSSVAYGIGWTGVAMTVVASLAITRIWLRLEDPKKRKKRELEDEKI